MSRFIFPGKTPFAIYAQYAGEDNSDGGSYLLGNAALSVGIDFPRIWHHFDLTYEVSEWQNIWYVHNIFLDGTTNNGIVEGNWGAQERVFNDGVGARMQMLRIGWEPPFGGYLQERVRTVVNENYYGGDSRQYSSRRACAVSCTTITTISRLTYSHPWKDTTLGGEVMYGRDIFGESFWRLSGFLRYGGDAKTRDDGEVEDESYQGGANPKGSEVFADIGVNVNRVTVNLDPEIAQYNTPVGAGPHFALGARRAVSDEQRSRRSRGDRRDPESHADRLSHHRLALSLRPAIRSPSAHSSGSIRYQLATPAYSEYAGLGAANGAISCPGSRNGTWDSISGTLRTSPATTSSPRTRAAPGRTASTKSTARSFSYPVISSDQRAADAGPELAAADLMHEPKSFAEA